jgi:hypothetical protein
LKIGEAVQTGSLSTNNPRKELTNDLHHPDRVTCPVRAWLHTLIPDLSKVVGSNQPKTGRFSLQLNVDQALEPTT